MKGRDLRIQGLWEVSPTAGLLPSLSLSVVTSKIGVSGLGRASVNSPFTYSQVVCGQARGNNSLFLPQWQLKSQGKKAS